MKNYTINDLVRLGATRDGLENAINVIQNELGKVNEELEQASLHLSAEMPSEEAVEVPLFEDNYPELELLDAA